METPLSHYKYIGKCSMFAANNSARPCTECASASHLSHAGRYSFENVWWKDLLKKG